MPTPLLPVNPYWASIEELPEGEGVTFDWDRRRTYTRRHLVEAKIEAMGPVDVALCPGVPLPGSFYVAPAQLGGVVVPLEYDRLAILTRQSAKRRNSDSGEWAWWIVTSEYGTEIRNRQDAPGGQDPSQDLADVAWDFEEVQEAKQHDLVGTPYINTAFDPFLRPPLFETNYPVLSISRNELTYNFATSSYYSRSLNDMTFLGVPRGIVQCLPPRGIQKDKGILRYWRTSYRLRFRPMQFNRTGSTDIKDLYRLPPINVYMPRTAGDGHDNKTNTGFIDETHPANDSDYLGQLIGDVKADTSGAVFYDPVPGQTGALRGRPGITFTEVPRVWDSWQPLIQLEGVNRLLLPQFGLPGNPLFEAGDADFGKVEGGVPVVHTPIYIGGHQVTHPVLLDWRGQPVLAKIITGQFPPVAPRPWYMQFVNYRYTNLSNLLVQGLT